MELLHSLDAEFGSTITKMKWMSELIANVIWNEVYNEHKMHAFICLI